MSHIVSVETDVRGEAAEVINRRPHCRAVLTGKRSLENYLHPEAIRTAGEIEVDFDDFDPAAEFVAKQLHQRSLFETPWELLTRRARNRLTHRAKRWLNTKVADQMTVDLLCERDTEGEIASWLKAIGGLAESR